MSKPSIEDLTYQLNRSYNDANEETTKYDPKHQISYDFLQCIKPEKVYPTDSTAVPVLRTAVNNLLPQLVALFTSSEKSVVKVKAIDGKLPQDLADALTKEINKIALSDNQVTKFFTDLITEALVFGDCFTKTYYEEVIKNVYKHKFEDMPESELDKIIETLLSLGYSEDEISIDTSKSEEKKLTKKDREQLANQSGIPLALTPKKVNLLTGSIKAILKEKNIKIDMLPFEEVYVPSRHRGNLTNSHYFCHEQTVRKETLIAMGYDAADVEEATGVSDRSPEAFNSGRGDKDNNNDYSTNDDYCDYAVIQEHYWKGKYDDEVEAYYKIVTGKEASFIMRKNGKHDIQRIDYIPVQNGKVMTMPSDFWGQSLYDLLSPLQAAKTMLQRSMIQAATSAAYGRYTVMKGQYDRESMLYNRPGTLIPITNPNAINILPTAPMPNGIMQLDEIFDNEIKAVVNGALGANELTSEMNGMSGAAISLLQSQDKTTSILMAHTLAETLFKPMYSSLLAIMQEIGHKLVLHGKAFDLRMLPADLEFIVDIDTADDDALTAQNLMNFLSTAIQQNGGQIPKYFTDDNIHYIYETYLKTATDRGDVSAFITAPEDLPKPSPIQDAMELLELKSKKYEMQLAEAKVTDMKADIALKLAQASNYDASMEKTLSDMDIAKIEAVLDKRKVDIEQFNAEVDARVKFKEAGINARNATTNAIKAASEVNKQDFEMAKSL